MLNRFTWMHSGQMGAPQMNGAAGSNGQMLQVLDGCLVDGFNPQTAVSATRTAATVTLTFGISHGYELRQIINVTGATDAVLNGNHRIISKTSNSVTIDAVGIGSVAGTISTKVAPLGFESIFGNANPLKRAYRSKNTNTTQTVLYLDMSLPTGHGYNAANPAKRAMVSMCEDMTELGVQINSYTNAKNNYEANPNGIMFWYQARHESKTTGVSDSNNNPWVVVGDGDLFYFFNAWQRYGAISLVYRDFYAFGDAQKISDSDSFNCFWMGAINPNDTSGIRHAFNGAAVGREPTLVEYNDGARASGFFIKPESGVGALQMIGLTQNFNESQMTKSGIDDLVTYPNPDSDTIIGLPIYFNSKKSLRAIVKNAYAVSHNLNQNLALDLQVFGDSLLVTLAHGGNYQPTRGFFLLNLRD